MKKQADWKESLKNFLQEHRQAVGVAAAAGAGGLIGGTMLPGLIYKKPTWGSRFMLGGGSAALTALAVMAALGKGQGVDSPVVEKGKALMNAAKEAPNAILGGMPTAKQFQTMSPTAQALYGKEGTGLGGWLVRNFKRSLPNTNDLFGKSQTDKKREQLGQSFKTSDDTSLARGLGNIVAGGTAGAATWKSLGSMQKNLALRSQLQRAVQGLKISGKWDTLPLEVKNRLGDVLNRGGIGDFGKAVAARVASGKANPLKVRVPFTDKVLWNFNPKGFQQWMANQRMSNPFLMSPGSQKKPLLWFGKGTNNPQGLMAWLQKQNLNDAPSLRHIANKARHRVKVPIGGKIGRGALSVLASLLAGHAFNALTSANKDYDAVVSQKLYQGMDK